MSLARLVITAVREGRSKSEVARDYQVSRYWVQATGETVRGRRRGRLPAQVALPAAQPERGACTAGGPDHPVA
jgi:hypothetical protein